MRGFLTENRLIAVQEAMDIPDPCRTDELLGDAGPLPDDRVALLIRRGGSCHHPVPVAPSIANRPVENSVAIMSAMRKA
jgi:hypothetical protein